jgi:hypothetical protein
MNFMTVQENKSSNNSPTSPLYLLHISVNFRKERDKAMIPLTSGKEGTRQ